MIKTLQNFRVVNISFDSALSVDIGVLRSIISFDSASSASAFPTKIGRHRSPLFRQSITNEEPLGSTDRGRASLLVSQTWLQLIKLQGTTKRLRPGFVNAAGKLRKVINLHQTNLQHAKQDLPTSGLSYITENRTNLHHRKQD